MPSYNSYRINHCLGCCQSPCLAAWLTLYIWGFSGVTLFSGGPPCEIVCIFANVTKVNQILWIQYAKLAMRNSELIWILL